MKPQITHKIITLVLTIIILVNSNITACAYDPVYESMTKPSESQSDYMKRINRDYGKIIGDTSSPKIKRVVSIGALYPTSGKKLPKEFSVYLGKMKLFAYSLSRERWIVLDNQPYPAGIFLYSLPWETSKKKQLQKDYLLQRLCKNRFDCR